MKTSKAIGKRFKSKNHFGYTCHFHFLVQEEHDGSNTEPAFYISKRTLIPKKNWDKFSEEDLKLAPKILRKGSHAVLVESNVVFTEEQFVQMSLMSGEIIAPYVEKTIEEWKKNNPESNPETE